MSRVADSSFLITLVDEGDPRQAQARELVSDPSPLLVPPEVVGETLGVLHARAGYERAQLVWEKLGDLANLVSLNSTRMEQIAPIFLDGGGDLSWTDAAVVAHCLVEDAEPLCFDEGIERAFGERSG